jgi:hypothetical protein
MRSMQIPALPEDWQRAILCLYYELTDGEICGLGNAVVFAAQGEVALALTAAHNATFVSRLAAKRSPFEDLVSARQANTKFASYVKTIHAERHCGQHQDLASIPTFRTPSSSDSDIALALVERLPTSNFKLEHYFGLKLLPPAIDETVVVIGSHSHKLIDVVDARNDQGRWMFEAQCVSIPARVTAHAEQGTLSDGPAFEIETELPSGLSGAPVLCVRDDELFVCGIVSSSADGSNRGCVAATWPVLGLSVPNAGEEPSETLIYDLARRGIIRTYGSELDRILMNANGTFGVRT